MKALITGGGGYLGSAIARQLLARGDSVTVMGRGRYPEVEALGAAGLVWDLSRDELGLVDALRGFDVVFHAAARAPVGGSRERFWSINVDGTRRVLEAAREAGVPRFVYTGSPSSTFDGGSHEGVTEADVPWPESYDAHYPESKAVAERMVTDANSETFATTALRPHLIWGPGEPHMLPRLIERHQAGRLRIIGAGDNRVAVTHVENAAAAHIQAADALAPGSANAGRGYFISDGGYVVIWEWVSDFFVGVGLPPLTRRVPAGLAKFVGAILEAIWSITGRQDMPPMTRFVATQLSTSHWYDLSAAEADFGYAPVIAPDEAWATTLADFKGRL